LINLGKRLAFWRQLLDIAGVGFDDDPYWRRTADILRPFAGLG
jgi:hypothetical protein